MFSIWQHLRLQASDGGGITDAMVASYADNRGLGQSAREFLSDVLIPFDALFRHGVRKLAKQREAENTGEKGGQNDPHRPGIRPLGPLPDE